jgi:hypothetical protein
VGLTLLFAPDDIPLAWAFAVFAAGLSRDFSFRGAFTRDI